MHTLHGIRSASKKRITPSGRGAQSFHPLSSDEIDSSLSDVKGYGGVYLREQLDDIKGSGKRVKCGIINLDDSDAMGNASRGGTHWTAWYDKCYFDSFGSPPPDEIMDAVNIKKYTSTLLQDPDDVSCGYWCICFIKLMQKNKGNFEHTMAELQDTTEADLHSVLRQNRPVIGGGADIPTLLDNMLALREKQMEKCEKVARGSIAETLKRIYTGDTIPGTGQTITSIAGKVASQVAQRAIPIPGVKQAVGKLVEFTFEGLANAVQNALNQTACSKAQDKVRDADKLVQNAVDKLGLKGNNLALMKTLIGQYKMPSQVNNRTVIAERIRAIAAGKEDPGSLKARQVKSIQKAIENKDPFLEAQNKEAYPRKKNKTTEQWENEVRQWFARNPAAKKTSMPDVKALMSKLGIK